jgi:tRNA/tmRNA/rRNA uracil-C5-methylase (TrmA/RlmC/RlmD family)
LFQLSNEGHSGIKDTIPFETLLGTGFITEELSGVKFTISPTSFFQVNTSVAELMYSYVAEKCTGGEKSAKPSLLLDLCCGTGTIGQLMASKFDKVVGIDIIESAINDARDNAKANGIENVEYFAGTCEGWLSKIILEMVYGMDMKKKAEEIKAAAEVKAAEAVVEGEEATTKPVRVWINPFPQAIKDVDPKYDVTAILDPPRGTLQIKLIN